MLPVDQRLGSMTPVDGCLSQRLAHEKKNTWNKHPSPRTDRSRVEALSRTAEHLAQKSRRSCKTSSSRGGRNHHHHQPLLPPSAPSESFMNPIAGYCGYQPQSLRHRLRRLQTAAPNPGGMSATVNESINFMSPIPKYCGYVPAVRQSFKTSPHALDMYSATARDFRTPLSYDQGATYKMPADDISDYRAQAHRYTGRSSMYVKDPEGEAGLKTFTFAMQANEFNF